MSANSLTAISDEKGDVRLLDTSPLIETGFAKEHIRINCHDNAVFDVNWSADDMKIVYPLNCVVANCCRQLLRETKQVKSSIL